MARKKTASDERYNARRRARRELARINKQIESGALSDQQRSTQEAYARRLEQAIQDSYIQRDIRPGMNARERRALTRRSDAALERAASAVESRRKSKTATERGNAAFAEQIRAAQAGERTPLSGLDKVSTTFFYVSTRQMWQGYPAAQRNEYIMRGLGVESLEEAYRIVTRANRQQIQSYRDMLAGITSEYTVEGWTDQAREFYEDAPIPQELEQPSPDNVVYFS